MADASILYQTFTNAGGNGALATDNFNKFTINTSDAGREVIVSATKGGTLSQADILAVTRQLTLGSATPPNDENGPDAFTIAGFGTADDTAFAPGTDTVVYFRLQGTGTPNLSTVSGVTLAAVAYFRPAL